MTGVKIFRAVREHAFHNLKLIAGSNLDGYCDSDLKELRDKFDDAQCKLLAALPTDKWEEEMKVATEFQEEYSTVRKRMMDLAAPPPAASSKSSRVKLPKIELHPFDGQIENWGPFIQLFNSLIHTNNGISDVEKMHYLLSSLRGRAFDLVKTIPIQPDNYQIAYHSLHKEFDRPRKIAFAHYEKLLSCEPVKRRSGAELKRVAQTFAENLAVLKRYKLPDANFMLVHLLLSKLDKTTKEAFEFEHDSFEVPSLEDLQSFIERYVRSTEFTPTEIPKSVETSVRPAMKRSASHQHHSFVVASPPRCPSCSGDHRLGKCEAFRAMDTKSRFQLVKENNLCLGCLEPGHGVKRCIGKPRCETCKQKHNTLLHFVQSPESPPSTSSSQSQGGMALTTSATSNCTLFSTMRLSIRDAAGNRQSVRALLDSASACNFISLKCARRLGLRIRRSVSHVSGIGHTSTQPLGTVEGKFEPSEGKFSGDLSFKALVLPSICPAQPERLIDWSDWSHIRGLKLADPTFGEPGTIDMLLNADFLASILEPGIVRGKPNQPMALRTQFGWVILGSYRGAKSDKRGMTPTTKQCLFVGEDPLNELLKRFWEVETVDSASNTVHWSERDQQCEEQFAKGHTRTKDGRFVVPLPFLDPSNKPVFQNSREVAMARFKSLERKLKAEPALKRAYVAFMEDYEKEGHMELVETPAMNAGRYYYIPHHGILRPESVTTPLRVVFDASARDANSLSLNDTLLPGPKLQANIFDLLIRFRWHPIVFTGDIKQMYRQILVTPQDADYQRILWRPSSHLPIRDYRLKTVTYGVSAAPFQALRVIAQTAKEAANSCSAASAVLSRDIYVDDIVTGASSLEQAKLIRDQLNKVFSGCGFHLRKWSSNSIHFLADIPPDDRYVNESRGFDDNSTVFLKVLGLQWIPTADHFSFKVTIDSRKYTKRTILSDIARLFDPLGFLCPLTFLAKCLIQRLWTSGLSWDDEVPPSIALEWGRFKSELQSVASLSIPRRMVNSSDRLQVHGFCDASERGYCAVIYCRSITSSNEHEVHLACAKSKVAPLRTLSIPRLELQAAVLLADLMTSFVDALRPLHIVQDVFAWSDSTVALTWIKSCPSNWKTFIANRVAHIQESIPPECWRHVSGSDNPADVGSRGAFPEELKDKTLWWNGPSWLCKSAEMWPRPTLEEDGSLLAAKEKKILSLIVSTSSNAIDDLLHRFSSLRTITRIIAYCHRFMNNCRLNRKGRKCGELTPAEVDHGLKLLIFHVQNQAFSGEIEHLRKGTPNQLDKAFRKLTPFLDEAGFLRVGGRLTLAALETDRRHPYLLPRGHLFTKLLIKDFHERFMHPGTQTLHNLLAARFWILAAKRAIKSVTRGCIQCFRASPPPTQPPLMGNLPPYRINQAKPFSIVAIDYGGPFDLALARGRRVTTTKGYICIFVCTVIKAIHIELASDLSSEAFLAALKRFVSRRGRCVQIISDQGRNFVGADSYLKKLLKEAADKEAIKFSFNPPGSPHFNGLAEAGIKSVKTHLRRVVGTQRLTYEEFYTVLVQIENILNSRPLTPLSNDPNDMTALTPNHFLTMASPAAIPEEDLYDQKRSLLTRWRLIQKIHQDFWHRWSAEYVHTLMQRSKWTTSREQIAIGTLVLLVNEQVAPSNWPLGRIVATHPGADGICRVVTVKTIKGEYKRSLNKICVLPIYD